MYRSGKRCINLLDLDRYLIDVNGEKNADLKRPHYAVDLSIYIY